MSNVAKLKKKAADLELKKDFAKALAVYVELLDDFDQHAGELDVSLFNRVGDLMLRQGNVADAVDYYERAVVRYVDGGFYNNAIALCNKILRHSPGRASVYYTLGKISAHKGFTTDAKQNFLEYADRMQKSGNLDEAFRALDGQPGQPDVRVGLAVRGGRQHLRGHGAAEVRHLLRPLVDEQQDEVHLGMVLRDGLAQVLEERGLARLGRRHDEPALAAPDGGDEVDDAQARLRLLRGQPEGLVRVDGHEVLEMRQHAVLLRRKAGGLLYLDQDAAPTSGVTG